MTEIGAVVARLRRAAGWRALGILSRVLLPFNLLWSFLAIFRHWRAVAAADIVAFYEDGGFGHTVIAPDGLRRLFPGRRIVLLFGAGPGVQNPFIAALWSNPSICLISFGRRARPGWPELAVPAAARRLAFGAAAKVVRRRFPEKVVLDSIREYRRALFDFTAVHGGAVSRHPDREDWPIAYFQLMSSRPMPPVRLPDELTTPIRATLDRACQRTPDGARKLACIYLRHKQSGEVAVDQGRTGSDLDAWLPALRLLIGRGYQCLLTGERALPGTMARELGGWFVDARAAGVPERTWSLFAATEADIFIGEHGGLSWLPGACSVPTLIVNMFPYLHARHRATLFYKPWMTKDCEPAQLAQAFGHAAGNAIDHFSIRSNTPGEIEFAVRDFLDGLATGLPYGVPVERLVPVDDDHWAPHAEARVSPAWIALFGQTKAKGRISTG